MHESFSKASPPHTTTPPNRTYQPLARGAWPVWLPRGGGWVGCMVVVWAMGMHSRTPPGRPRTAGPELEEDNERPPASCHQDALDLRTGLSSAAAPMAVTSEAGMWAVGSAGLVGSGERRTSRGGAAEPGTRAESTRAPCPRRTGRGPRSNALSRLTERAAVPGGF